MAITTRNAKNWLESVILDEDDMTSDSATDVASQQSIKAYVDANASDFEWPVVELTASDHPYTATNLQTVYRVRPSGTTGGTFTFNLPAVDSSNRGQQILILHDDGGTFENIQVSAAAFDNIEGSSSYTINPGRSLHAVTRDDTPDRWAIIGYDATRDFILDEDDMASNDAEKAASQQSVKAYVDSSTSAVTNPSYSWTQHDSTDSPVTLAVSDTTYYDDNTGSAMVYNIPSYSAVTDGDRIIIFVERNAGGITVNTGTGDIIGGSSSSYTIPNTTSNTKFEFIAATTSLGGGWIVLTTTFI